MSRSLAEVGAATRAEISAAIWRPFRHPAPARNVCKRSGAVAEALAASSAGPIVLSPPRTKKKASRSALQEGEPDREPASSTPVRRPSSWTSLRRPGAEQKTRRPTAKADAKARQALSTKARELRKRADFAVRLRTLSTKVLAHYTAKRHRVEGQELGDKQLCADPDMSEADARRALDELDVAEGRAVREAAAMSEAEWRAARDVLARRIELGEAGLADAPEGELAQPPQPLTAPGADTEAKARLERAATLIESLLWRARKVVLRETEARSATHAFLMDSLRTAAVECEAVLVELSTCCQRWIGTARDSAAAKELTPRAEEVTSALDVWVAAAGSIAQRD